MSDIRHLDSLAANMRSGENPVYTRNDFLEMYPQFGEVPPSVIDSYVEMAVASVLKARWHSKWKVAIGLFIAHFLTLWLMTGADAGQTPGEIVGAAESKGAVMSKSVDGVSVSYGQSAAESDLQGWGSFKETLYGQQFATLAKFVGKGGMYVR